MYPLFANYKPAHVASVLKSSWAVSILHMQLKDVRVLSTALVTALFQKRTRPYVG